MIRSLIFLALVLMANNLDAEVDKGDDVTLEQLRETEHPREQDAAAAYLLNKRSTEYLFSSADIVLLSYHHQRVKVYKESGEKHATFSIKLYGKGGDSDRISGVKGFTYNEVDGSIEKTKLEKSEIFKEETSEYVTTVKFALPKVKSGSIVDVKYTIRSKRVRTIPKFFFQHFIPVEYSEYKMSVPEFFVMSPVPKGAIPLATEQSSQSANGYNEEIYTFFAGKIPSIKEDDYVLNVNDYRGSLHYEISSYQFRGGVREKLSGDWNYVAKSLMDSKSFGGVIGSQGKMYEDIVSMASGTNDEKIAFLYDYVRSNNTWDGYYNKYASQSSKEFLKSKKGNVADINMQLLNLLIKAGINAEPVVTRHRFSGVLNANFPSSSELNYFLVKTTYKDKVIFLDASSKYVQIGQLPIRAVNIEGLVVSEDGGKVISIINPNVNKRKFMAEYALNIEEDMVMGSCKGRLAGFAAVKFRQAADEQNEEEEEDNQDLESDEVIEIEEVEVENEFIVTSVDNIDDLNKPIGFEANEKNYKIMTKIGNEIFLAADLDMGINKNPFTEEERVFPTFFNYKQDWTNVAKVAIPDGYEVKSIPENVSLTLPDNLGKFKYLASVNGDVLMVQYIFKINRDYFLSSEYEGLKKLYNMIITKQKEKIILAKSGNDPASK